MDFDGSSYPKAPQQQYDPFGAIGKAQQIEQQGLAIDREKIAKYNEQYNLVNRGLGNLINVPKGELTPDHLQDFYQSLVKMGVPADTVAKEMSTIPTYAVLKKQYPNASNEQLQGIMDQKIRKIGEVHMLQAQEKHDALANYAGQSVDKDAGNQTVFGVQGGLQATGRGMAPRTFQQTGNSLVRQPAAGTPGVDENNNPTFNKATPPQYIAPGAVQSAPLAPVSGGPANKLPIAPAAGPTGAAAQGNAFKPAPPQMFEEGKKQLAGDLDQANNLIQSAKPLQQTLKHLNPEVLTGITGTGPIAEKLTKAVSAVNGVLGIKGDLADRVAAREEIVKKMSKYIAGSSIAGRSDMGQVLSAASSPNPNAQSLKALVNLTRDAIAADRVNAAKALAFKDKDFSKYLPHKGSFANSIDQDAFKLDTMEPKERDEFIKSKMDGTAGEKAKFVRSMKLAQELQMYEP